MECLGGLNMGSRVIVGSCSCIIYTILIQDITVDINLS